MILKSFSTASLAFIIVTTSVSASAKWSDWFDWFDGGAKQPLVKSFIGKLMNQTAIDNEDIALIVRQNCIMFSKGKPKVCTGWTEEGTEIHISVNADGTFIFPEIEESNGQITTDVSLEIKNGLDLSSQSFDSQAIYRYEYFSTGLMALGRFRDNSEEYVSHDHLQAELSVISLEGLSESSLNKISVNGQPLSAVAGASDYTSLEVRVSIRNSKQIFIGVAVGLFDFKKGGEFNSSKRITKNATIPALIFAHPGNPYNKLTLEWQLSGTADQGNLQKEFSLKKKEILSAIKPGQEVLSASEYPMTGK